MRSVIYEKIKTFADDNGYQFYYGVKGYQNLETINNELNAPVIYLAPIIERANYGTNWNRTLEYDILIFIGVKSDLDEDYDEEKWLLNIKPLENIKEALCQEIGCSSIKIKSSRVSEAINEFDGNLDGLNIECSLAI